MAKRIQFRAHGGPEVLEYVDYQPAEPGPQQVSVSNKAIGLNFIDTYFRSGLYAPPALPSGLGAEGAGVVQAVGSQVTRFKVGDRVAYGSGPLGAYSDVHVLPEANLVHLPAAISFDAAMRALGRRWKLAQRLVYPALVLSLAHWLLLDWEWQPAAVHLTPLLIAWGLRFTRPRAPITPPRST